MNGPGTGTGRAAGGPGDGVGPGPGTVGGPGDGGIGTGPGGTASEHPMEDRLRRAFAARAESIAVRDLRPAAPPGPHTRRNRLPGMKRPWPRRFGLPLAAAAATAAVVIGYLAIAPGTPPDRRPAPATPPSPVDPAPSPTRTGSTPVPSPSHPSAGPHRTARPTGSTPPGAPVSGAPRPPRSGSPTPRPTDQPSGGSSSTGLPPPSTTPSAGPTPHGSSRAVPGNGDSSPSPGR
ncbi:hypothetical protein OHT20_18185 [Streptomyces caniferus]|uniref:hypothetical protein n=1 Tax=Streptomyces caniferus TaxID=285557 RepID=UPI002E27FAF7|nr:hypothetical protein [Streptomyces caniferus]